VNAFDRPRIRTFSKGFSKEVIEVSQRILDQHLQIVIGASGLRLPLSGQEMLSKHLKRFDVEHSN
jgi:hypothetical protein